MDMGIWTWVYGQVLCFVLLYIVLNVFHCAALRLRCDSMLLGFVVGGCYGLVSRCFSE